MIFQITKQDGQQLILLSNNSVYDNTALIVLHLYPFTCFNYPLFKDKDEQKRRKCNTTIVKVRRVMTNGSTSD